MVTISIVGVILAWAVSSFSDVISNNRVKTTASIVLSALQEARSEALKQNKTATVTVGSTAVVTTLGTTVKTIPYGVGTSGGVTVVGGTVLFSSTGQEKDLASHTIKISDTSCATAKSCLNIQVYGGGYIKLCNPSQGDENAPNYCK